MSTVSHIQTKREIKYHHVFPCHVEFLCHGCTQEAMNKTIDFQNTLVKVRNIKFNAYVVST